MKKTSKEYYEEKDYSSFLEKVPLVIGEFLDLENMLISDYLKSGDVVLEVACGAGRSFPFIEKNASRIVGIDYSEKQVEKARLARSISKNYSSIHVLHMDATKTIFPNDSFDKALCLGHSFGNFENNEHVLLDEMLRVIKPNGELYLTVLNQDARYAHEQLYINNNFTILENEETHIRLEEGLYSRRFSKDDLHGIIKNTNIKNYEISELTPITYQLICKK